MSHKRKSYTSDVSEAQWMVVKDLLPLDRKGPGRPLEIDMREVLKAIFYVLKTSCQWENLPHDFPNYQSVYYHYNKWYKDGTWAAINQALRYEVRIQEGRCPHPTRRVSTVRVLKRQKWGVNGVMMLANRSKVANAIF